MVAPVFFQTLLIAVPGSVLSVGDKEKNNLFSCADYRLKEKMDLYSQRVYVLG